MTARATFKQSDLTRAYRGAVKGGAQIERIEIGPDGKIVIILATDHSNDNEGGRGWEDA